MCLKVLSSFALLLILLISCSGNKVEGDDGLAEKVVYQKVIPDTHTIAITSTTHAAFLTALGLEHRLVASAWADHLLDSALVTKVADGSIVNLTKGESVDMELLISSGAKVLLYDPMEGDFRAKCHDLGILAIPIAEYKAKHPLERAAWVMQIGKRFGKTKEVKGQLIFAQIKSRYLEMKSSVLSQTSRPKVLLGSIYQGKWYAPGANSLAAKWIEDAGGEYVIDIKGDGNVTLDIEEIMEFGADVDFFGHMGAGPMQPIDNLFEADRRLKKIKALKEANVFYCNTNELDYFGQAIMEPEVILGDIIKAIHPKAELDHEQTYFKSLGH